MKTRIPLLAVLLASVGCLDDEPDLAETASEVKIVVSAELETKTSDGKVLGPLSDMTCFLRGVSGDLKSVADRPARVEVIPQAGNWLMVVKAGTGTGVKARVICVNIPYAKAVEFSWQDNVGGSVSAVNPNRRCFLRSVWAANGLDQASSNITIRKPNGTFSMNGSFAAHAGVNRAGATAVCLDEPAVFAAEFGHVGPASGNATIQINVPTPDHACGLTSIYGIWPNQNDLFGVEDGVYASNGGPFWRLTASNTKGGRWHCYR